MKNQRYVRSALAGLGLAIAAVVLVHWLAGPEHQYAAFAMFLALTSCVYGGAALTPAGARHGHVELPGVALIFAAAVAGLLFSPLWTALGYVGHGLWDWLHHRSIIKTPVVAWFPPTCAAFDLAVGLWIAASITLLPSLAR